MNAVYSHPLRARAPMRVPLALALSAALGVAQATTFTVTTNGDAGDGTCDASCTLRDAVAAANLNAGADTITFASTLSGDTILLDITNHGHIAITDSLTIQGPGANLLVVSGGDVASTTDGGIFSDNVPVSSNALTLSGITLTNGNTAGKGGAVSMVSGHLTLSGVAIQNSHAQSFGGGFYKGGGTLAIDHGTISGNSSSNSGGGFSVNYPTTSLIDTTISGNTANGSGGGFYARTTISLFNSTISGNTANSIGGGAWISKQNGYFTNSIVANNSAPSMSEFACTAQSNGASSVTANNSLIEGSYGCTGGGTFTGSGNIFGQDPKLGRLANNGGPTQTQALLPGSPAIDTGNNSTCEATDQRGQSRPYDGDKNGSAICDMGAFEVNFIDLDTIFANGFD
ncbi:MAG TPA: choice-of-anchor Q domain-containing protein [Rudaea sp.]|nr:choice-of-anchor Q domain-containing protein [Rudaea sp.]